MILTTFMTYMQGNTVLWYIFHDQSVQIPIGRSLTIVYPCHSLLSYIPYIHITLHIKRLLFGIQYNFNPHTSAKEVALNLCSFIFLAVWQNMISVGVYHLKLWTTAYNLISLNILTKVWMVWQWLNDMIRSIMISQLRW